MQNQIHGFSLLQESNVPELNGTASLYEHEKSGARLLHLGNDDDNKVFSIFFRTPPADSTGVAHILEHSVLCGSKKFPCKEPFVELMKGSLNTFLNAFTFSDKTGYPVASRNEKDFFNLMDVYLDAVFHPNIYDRPEIFLQEGWHYSLPDKDAALLYNGVVYNEMKGAFSSPEQILYRKIEESLFPDTPYGVESGGVPDDIPALSYEQFLDFHKTYYHPANSYIFLYGNGDINRQLAFLNDSYLDTFSRLAIDSAIPLQSPFANLQHITDSYPVGDDEDLTEKAFFAMNFATVEVTDAETVLGLTILNRILLQTAASPLKKALIDAGIGKDVTGHFDTDIRQPVLSIIAKHADSSQKSAFCDCIKSTLEKEIENGLSEKLVDASINNIEFQLREADYHSFPKGLVYAIQCMSTWLYDGDPLAPLRYEQHIAAIKTKAKSGYFEKLIRTMLLDNPHASLVTLLPEQGLNSKNEANLKEKLAVLKARFSSQDLDTLVIKTKKLGEYQQAADTSQDLATIPLLELSDVNTEAERLPLDEKNGGTTTLFHPIFTHDISYVDLYFDTASVPKKLIPYLALLDRVMGRMNTSRYDYISLSNELNIHLGDISFSAHCFSEYKNRDVYHPKFIVSAKALTAKTDTMTELIEEVILHSDFSDRRRLQEIIREIRSHLEMQIMHSGHVYARRRIASYLTARGYFQEQLSGISFYLFIKDLDDNFSEKAETIAESLCQTAGLVFHSRNALISITADQNDLEKIDAGISGIINNCPDSRPAQVEQHLMQKMKNEGFIIPGQVQYVAKGTNLGVDGVSYDNRLLLLQTILGTDYLWNNVRVMGGAYGAAAKFLHDGTVYFSSYRDPNLADTLKIYNAVPHFIRSFAPDAREMRKYIIGTIGQLDAPLTPSMKGERATEDFISHIEQDDIQQERDDILSATAENLTVFADPLEDAMSKGICCTIGSEAKIRENEELFDSVTSLM